MMKQKGESTPMEENQINFETQKMVVKEIDKEAKM